VVGVVGNRQSQAIKGRPSREPAARCGSKGPIMTRLIVGGMRGSKRALELSATALILVHNHPSGDPTPSHADIQMTQSIVEVARPLGIAVHDHIIVGKDGHASFKGLRLI
jgi:hypothetical protein